MARNRSERDPKCAEIADKIVRFVNIAFGRKLAASRALHDAIRDAMADGYTEDEIRVVYWVARCLPGTVWLKSALAMDCDRGSVAPELALRHHGELNPITGQPAKRWLDEMLSRRLETNPQLIGVLLDSLPTEMSNSEKALLARMEIPFEIREAKDATTH